MKRLTFLLAALMLCATVAAVHRPRIVYRVEPIASSPHDTGEALAINARGDVAGQLNDSAFIWHAGHVTLFSPLPFLAPGDAVAGIARTINRSGLAGGSEGYYTPCAMTGLALATATLFRDGKTSYVDPSPNVRQCGFEVNGMNDEGAIVGVKAYRGFVRYPNGKELEIQPLSTRPVDNGTSASAIDNEGHVVGGTTINVKKVRYLDVGILRPRGKRAQILRAPDPNSYFIHAFVATFVDGTQHMRDLGALPGFPDTFATALNEGLTIVGYSGNESGPKWTRVSGKSHAWVWQNGRMSDLGSALGESSYAYGVNDADTIVGCDGDDAVRWVDKREEDLNTLIDPHSGWHLTCARAINRVGRIVGTGTYEGHQLPFRLVPIPG
ncbi:MAG TPA: hypothetical protein VMV73_03795 [Candidatus Dormibacteraeota bacterium]|nr:hypothetical protein [Candidatus Dormibacteraeota bacterium]